MKRPLATSFVVTFASAACRREPAPAPPPPPDETLYTDFARNVEIDRRADGTCLLTAGLGQLPRAIPCPPGLVSGRSVGRRGDQCWAYPRSEPCDTKVHTCNPPAPDLVPCPDLGALLGDPPAAEAGSAGEDRCDAETAVSCQKDSDCVVASRISGCCPNPCSHVAVRRDCEERRIRFCATADNSQCPHMGVCKPPGRANAACREGTCVVVAWDASTR
jgi:hypothetical protein